MRFAITGLGRSGTHSLAHALKNNSNGVDVHHERDNSVLNEPSVFNDRTTENYGEVSSYLRRVLLRLDVDVRMVILRNPYDILSSALRRQPEERWGSLVVDVAHGLFEVDALIGAGVPVIDFYAMVKSNYYRTKFIYDKLGLVITDKAFPRIDPSPQIKVTLKPQWVERLRWFADKYFSKGLYEHGNPSNY